MTDLTNQPTETTIPSYKTRYRKVNGAWPEGELPKPTGPEAITACRLLYRKFLGRPFRGPFKLTSGNRHTWPRSGVFYVNPDHWRDHGGGWRALVHSMSHLVWRRMFPNASGHATGHAHLEKQMVDHVVMSGWLDGKLRRAPRVKIEKPQLDIKQVRLTRINARIEKWITREKRAKTALAKLRRQAKGYVARGVTL